MLMGSLDCITTVIGVLYHGAIELNPVMAGVVSNIPLFAALKLAATVCIVGTYILANRILTSTALNKTSKSFRYSNIGRNIMNVVYVGLIVFLGAVVVNNFMVLLA